MLKYLTYKGKKYPLKLALSENSPLLEYFPMPYLNEVCSERRWSGLPSVTQLISGTRCEYLKILCPYGLNPDEETFRVLGSMAHLKLESENVMTEIHFETEKIQGTADLIEKLSDETYRLIDYKVSGSFKVAKALGIEKFNTKIRDEYGKFIYEFRKKEPEMHDWTLQTNKYRVELEKKLNIVISQMCIYAVVRDGGCWIAKDRGVIDNSYMINVPFLENDNIEKYFKEKRKNLLEALDNYAKEKVQTDKKEKELIIDNIPARCSTIENWNLEKCKNYCPVKEFCYEANRVIAERKKNE